MPHDIGDESAVCMRTDGRQVEIAGIAESLQKLAYALANAPSELVLRRLTKAESDPYPHALKYFKVSDNSNKIVFRVKGNTLYARGAIESRRQMAQNIKDFAIGAVPGDSNHIHEEYYPGHFYLSDGSIPVIIYKE